MLACAMAVTSVPSTGTMVYASEDLFSDGGTETFEPIEDVSVFNDGSAENTEESISEDIWSAADESEIAVTSDWDYDFDDDYEGGGLVNGIDSGLRVEKSHIVENVSLGDDVEFEVKASVDAGCGEITYQWYDVIIDWDEYKAFYSYEKIDGETSSTFKILNVQDDQIYRCKVYDEYGNFVTVDCYIYIDTGLQIEKTTREKTIEFGEDVTFEVKASANAGFNIKYQWYKSVGPDLIDAKVLRGETSATLHLSNVEASATYWCRVSAGYGSAKEVFFDVIVNKKDTGLTVEQSRVEKYVKQGSATTLKVNASVNAGCGEITYQWYSCWGDGFSESSVLSGQTSAELRVDNVRESTAYYCEVSDMYGKTETVMFYIYVDEKGLVLDSTPINKTVSPGATVKFEIKTSINSGYSIEYEWWKYNGDDFEVLEGEKTNDLTLSNVQKSGKYCCQVHVIGTMKSIPVYCYVNVEGKKHEHTWGSWKVTKKATYTAAGVKTRMCKGCDAEETEQIARLAIPAPVLKEVKATAYNKITVTWEAVSGVYGYRVYRKTGDGSYKSLKYVTGADKTSYVDTTAKSGVTYTYTVKAYCKDGDKNIYSSYDQTGKSAVTKAKAPTLVSAKATAYNKITFSWKAVSGVDGYRVYRKTGSGSYKPLGYVSKDKTSYVDSTVKSGVKYTYTVRAYHTSSSGSKRLGYYSETGKSATAKAKAPTLVSAKATAYNKITFSWKAVSGVDGYRVYRKSGSDSYKPLGYVSKDKTSYVDSTVKSGVKYTYTVRAYHKSSSGSKLLGYYSETGKSVTAKAKAPTISSVSAQGSGKVKVSWKSVSGVDGYQVYRKTKNGSWKVIGTVSSKATSYTDKTAKKGVTYYYTVRAYNNNKGSKVLGFYDTKGKSVKAK